jgi:hypothetical protein
MRYFLLSLAAFLLLAIPAFAVGEPTSDTVEVTVIVHHYCSFDVVEPTLKFDFVDCGEYLEGVLTYNLCCNGPQWLIDGFMKDSVLPGTFTVNGHVMTSVTNLVDGNYGWVCRKGWTWPVTMTVPFGTVPATYVDTLTLTLYCK